MPSISALDTVIAIVVVLLVLSLIVQSIQHAMKKLFKIKSRQLVDSLIDLFECAGHLAKPESEPQTMRQASPVIRNIVGRLPLKLQGLGQTAPQTPEQIQARALAERLTKAVVEQLRLAGRVAQSGKAMIDSLNKADLMKVLERVGTDLLSHDNVARVQTVITDYQALKERLGDFSSSATSLPGDANSKLATLQEMLGPLINDLQVFIDRQVAPGTTPPPETSRVADLLDIRDFKAAEALAVIGEMQKQVAAVLGKPDLENRQVLTDLSTQLNRLAEAVGRLSQTLDAAVAPLKQRLVAVESWYDTVMAGFEERYNRSMRTWAIVLGFVVVVVFNADFFKVARTISQNDIVRNRIVDYGAQLTKARSDTASAESQLEATQRELDAASSGAEPNAAQVKSLTERRDREAKRVNDMKESAASLDSELKSNVATYSSFGFDRLRWADVSAWFSDWSLKELPGKLKRSAMGLLGWLVTALLVSIGAPFWQDVLESMFGIKNLLREKGKKGKDEKGLHPRPSEA